jgi:hypothetical protein
MGDRLRVYEVFLPDRPRPVEILAFNKAHAMQTANELFPDVPLTMFNIFERHEW